MNHYFETKEMLEDIAKTYPTPFYLYDEAAIRKMPAPSIRRFPGQGFKEYFAVKATPTPAILKILKEEGCGVDCSSYTELKLSERCGFTGHDIMFSSNETPAREYVLADQLGAIINLDDYTMVDYLQESIGHIPETICCRFNPGGEFKITSEIMDTPGEAKYGMTPEQIKLAYRRLKEMGAKRFWHASLPGLQHPHQ